MLLRSASSHLRNSAAVIETLSPVLESTGIYYVELNPILYTFSDIYEIKWNVQYISIAPNRILTTRFRMEPINYVGGVIAEVVDNQIIIEIGNAA